MRRTARYPLKFFALLLVCGLPAAAQEHPQAPADKTPAQEHRITPEEARELLNSVDKILKFDSEQTLLEIRRPVKRQLVDRDEVQRFIQKRLEDDEDARRLQRAEIVLKKFGLLPRDFDMRAFLIELLREQVAGYYDPKTKTVYLLNWLEPESQMPVMAHELTHALQDQHVDVERWVKQGTSDKSPQASVTSDEEIGARHAVLEGQAMAVMVGYLLAPVGGTLANSPMITQAIEQSMMQGDGSPVFDRAPLFIKRMLLFPYQYGLEFERTLLVKAGKERAFAGVLKRPPRNTREVMEPEVYLAGEQLPELPVADVAKIAGGEWEKYDVGSIGEFDVSVMAEQYASEGKAKKIAPQWRGGWYYAIRPKSGDSVALVFVSKWGTCDAAQQFENVYADSIADRYKGSKSAGAIQKGLAGECGPEHNALWQTAEGPVWLSRSGTTLVVVEGLENQLAAKVKEAVLANKR